MATRQLYYLCRPIKVRTGTGNLVEKPERFLKNQDLSFVQHTRTLCDPSSAVNGDKRYFLSVVINDTTGGTLDENEDVVDSILVIGREKPSAANMKTALDAASGSTWTNNSGVLELARDLGSGVIS